MAQPCGSLHHCHMMKLLVVDDSELIRSRLVSLLQGLPGMAKVDTAGTLTQTLERAAHCMSDMAIVDLHLPDGNAIRILPQLRQLVPDMHIAVLTNDASEFNRSRCLKAGADWFYDKSTEFEKVLELVQIQAALHAITDQTTKQAP